MSSRDNKILEFAKKLYRMANSSSTHEAKIAKTKLEQIVKRYNLKISGFLEFKPELSTSKDTQKEVKQDISPKEEDTVVGKDSENSKTSEDNNFSDEDKEARDSVMIIQREPVYHIMVEQGKTYVSQEYIPKGKIQIKDE